MTRESDGGAAAPLQAVWALVAILRHRRAIVASGLGVAVLVGVVVLLKPRTYTASASVLPKSGVPAGNLAGIAASLGFNLPTSDQAESPAFYADLVRTPTILLPVVQYPFRFPDSTATPSTLEDIYAVRGGSEILRADAAVRRLQRDLHPTLNLRTGVVRLEATMKNPVLAYDVVVRLLDELDKYNLGRRQSQAGAERQFTERQAAEAKDSLTQAENRLKDFLLKNRGDLRASPELEFEQSRLERDMQLRQQVYTTLVQAYEQARIEEVRNTPVLSVVEPPVVPARPDGRALVLKVLIGGLVGGLVALLLVLAGASLSPGAAAIRPEGLLEEWASARNDLRHPVRALLEVVRAVPRRA